MWFMEYHEIVHSLRIARAPPKVLNLGGRDTAAAVRNKWTAAADE